MIAYKINKKKIIFIFSSTTKCISEQVDSISSAIANNNQLSEGNFLPLLNRIKAVKYLHILNLNFQRIFLHTTYFTLTNFEDH